MVLTWPLASKRSCQQGVTAVNATLPSCAVGCANLRDGHSGRVAGVRSFQEGQEGDHSGTQQLLHPPTQLQLRTSVSPSSLAIQFPHEPPTPPILPFPKEQSRLLRPQQRPCCGQTPCKAAQPKP